MSRRQLTLRERCIISYLLEKGYNRKEIAEEIYTTPGTITRELQRNTFDNTYDPEKAHECAEIRRGLPRKLRVIDEEFDRPLIKELLELGLVPEQISQVMKKYLKKKISTAALYNYIKHPVMVQPDLERLLPRSRPGKRRYTKSVLDENARKNRLFIASRSKEANERAEAGHLEMDTIVSRGRKGGVLVIVDRKTLYTWAKQVPDLCADTIKQATFDLLKPIKHRVKSITSDNGSEFSDWKAIKKGLKCEYYFCDPYSSWQRGTVENTNGIIRRDFPKKTDFSKVDEKHFQFRIELMNQRLRKRIGFKTPYELFFNKPSFWDTHFRLRS